MKDDFIGKVGIYGQMHYRVLKENKPSVLGVMRMKGTLKPYLEEVNTNAEDMLIRLETEMAKSEGVTEALKRHDQIEWVCRKNNIRARVWETVQAEIYIMYICRNRFWVRFLQNVTFFEKIVFCLSCVQNHQPMHKSTTIGI